MSRETDLFGGVASPTAAGFNAGHVSLLMSRFRREQRLEEIEAEIGEFRENIAALLTEKDTAKKHMDEIDAVIYKADFTPPEGFNLWGERIES